MAVILQTERIMSALMEIGRFGPWYPRTFDPASGEPSVDTGTEVVPQSIFVRETGAGFVPAHMKRTFKRDITQWAFELSVAFQQAVSLETFQDRLANQPPFLPAMDSFRQVQLLLVGARVTHPPQQQPQTGTRAWFTFHAELTPS